MTPAAAILSPQADALPTTLNTTYGWNAMSFTQDALCTTPEGVQYAVWVDTAKHPVIGKRSLPSGAWETFDLGTIPGNPLVSPTVDDLHNTYSIGVDSAGHIHVSGNHHNNPLRYVRSADPGDITAWVAPGMTGANDNSVTYPQFVTLPDGTLMFFWRNGSSGDGDVFAAVYDTGAESWVSRGKILDGLATGENPYPNRIGVDRATGMIHMAIIWRGDPNANSNNDISYLRSPDAGVTWERSNGSAYVLPVTHTTIEEVVHIPANSGLINQNGLDVDTAGRVHIGYMRYDANGYHQYHHTYHDGSTWVTETVTQFRHRMDIANLVDFSIARPAIVCDAAGRTFLVSRTDFEEAGGVCIREVTPGGARGFYKLYDGPLADWEPIFDGRAAVLRNDLSMIVVAQRYDGLEAGDVAGDWTARTGLVVTIGLEQIT